ncbi:MAG: tetraacyldisaccharide 4'-kinase [Thermodesulfovibrionales bacterium]|nr:tetraacyldisaccharide 4'-kinase [Thermodesulfovibrionales bacterium]
MLRLLNPFEFLYYLGSSLKKNYLFSRRKRLPNKVISVGNITTGGTGKTPATIALAQEAKRRGFEPVILTRGYKGRAKKPVLINFPHSISTEKLSPLLVGDEAFMMSKKIPEIPIVKFHDRYIGAQLALDKLSKDSANRVIFILDDGFQQWGLFLDINILLIDGLNPFGNRRLLPFGKLRELPEEVKRADIIVITKIKNEGLLKELRQLNPNSLVFNSKYEIRDVKNIKGDSFSPLSLRNKRVYAFCGIAEPASFKALISSVGAEIVYLKSFSDHYIYKERDLDSILRHAKELKSDYIMTTEKDIIKVSELTSFSGILYLDIYFSIDEAFYDEVFKLIG